jgi:hypothetical protein
MNHPPFKASSGQADRPRFPGRTILLASTFGALFLMASCGNNQTSGAPHATILMRDGTTLAGTVSASSPAEITLAGDDKVTHTVPMTQVKSVEYDDNAAAQTGAPGATPVPSQPASAARAASDAVHEHHYHPSRAEIHTKTYVLPVDTQVSVRSEETIDSATAAEGSDVCGRNHRRCSRCRRQRCHSSRLERSDRHPISFKGRALPRGFRSRAGPAIDFGGGTTILSQHQ